MLKNLNHCLILLSSLVFCTQAECQITQVGPPYPEIWGHDLSTFPSLQSGFSEMKAFKMNDGDIWFLSTYSYKIQDSLGMVDKNVDFKYKLIPFFKGKQKLLSEKEHERLLKRLAGKEIFLEPEKDAQLVFSDKSKLSLCTKNLNVKHSVPDYYNYFFEKTDVNGHVRNYSVLGAAVQVEMYRDKDAPSESTLPFFYKKLYHFKKMIPLKDDTFILVDKNQNLILRFDACLRTKFKPVTSVEIQGDYVWQNFFIIDTSVIQKLEDNFLKDFSFYHPNTRPPAYQLYQNVHDNLLYHLGHDYD